MMTEHEISFSQLRCFIAVVDAGSLATAGRQLGMSTPSVSKAIARLEQTSGVKRLHRSTHAVSLTQDGERLVESAREVVRAAGVFAQSARAQTQTGRVIQNAPDPTTIYDDGGSAWNAALHGGGIVSAPLWLAAADLRAGRAVELLREWRDVDVTMSFLRRARRLTPQRVNRVIAYLRRHAPALVDLI